MLTLLTEYCVYPPRFCLPIATPSGKLKCFLCEIPVWLQLILLYVLVALMACLYYAQYAEMVINATISGEVQFGKGCQIKVCAIAT